MSDKSPEGAPSDHNEQDGTPTNVEFIQKGIDAARRLFFSRLTLMMKGLAHRDDINMDEVLSCLEEGDRKREKARVFASLEDEGSIQIVSQIKTGIHLPLYGNILHLHEEEVWLTVDPPIVATTINMLDPADRLSFAKGIHGSADHTIRRSKQKKMIDSYRKSAARLCQFIEAGTLPYSCIVSDKD